jgi:hypothetical protein
MAIIRAAISIRILRIVNKTKCDFSGFTRPQVALTGRPKNSQPEESP